MYQERLIANTKVEEETTMSEKKMLVASGHFSWDAVERRSDRYGSVRLNHELIADSGNSNHVLLDASIDDLEGKYGRLTAEVLLPVDSPHIGDLHRGLRPSTPSQGEVVLLGTGYLFVEHRGKAPHEKDAYELQDDKLMDESLQEIQKAVDKALNEALMAGVKIMQAGPIRKVDISGEHEDEEIYDLIGLKPKDGRATDWLNPASFYRLHLSKINLYFEELDESEVATLEKSYEE